MNGYYTQVIAVLREHGFFCLRQKGSHQTWKNDGSGLLVTVSTNCHSRVTANAIMKQAGIAHKF